MLCFCLSTSSTLGSWIKLSPKQLVTQSNLAVIGEYIGTTRIKSFPAGNELIVGVIKVNNILKGSVQDELILIAIRNAKGALMASTTSFKKGQKGLWLLTQYSPDNAVLYSANHPQQFIPSSNIDAMSVMKKLLIKQKGK